ncbi:hypothetical protein KPL71_008971 [Citrus sinensis]|uniref:Uncharacterized protein n=1 Tax=Citrus sinensis TaxID=2711 RepID=A0ACB8MAL6_CITSI|nr:hypothetical protein KPL71_008971 [Citrus sinensis]
MHLATYHLGDHSDWQISSPLPSEILVLQEFLNEIKALPELWYQNIVKFYSFCNILGSLATIPSNDATIEEFMSWTLRIKNVLLGLDYEAHVSDSGIAKFLKPDLSYWTDFAGAFGYLVYTMKIIEKCNGNYPRDFMSFHRGHITE